MQDEQRGINRPSLADRLKELRTQPPKIGIRDRAA